MGLESNPICCIEGKPLCVESVGGGNGKRKYEGDCCIWNRIGCTDFVGDCFLCRNRKLSSNSIKLMEKDPQSIKRSSRSAKPSTEEQKIQGKPKTGKIVRVVPMGVPLSPKRFKQIQELSHRNSDE